MKLILHEVAFWYFVMLPLGARSARVATDGQNCGGCRATRAQQKTPASVWRRGRGAAKAPRFRNGARLFIGTAGGVP